MFGCRKKTYINRSTNTTLPETHCNHIGNITSNHSHHSESLNKHYTCNKVLRFNCDYEDDGKIFEDKDSIRTRGGYERIESHNTGKKYREPVAIENNSKREYFASSCLPSCPPPSCFPSSYHELSCQRQPSLHSQGNSCANTQGCCPCGACGGAACSHNSNKEVESSSTGNRTEPLPCKCKCTSSKTLHPCGGCSGQSCGKIYSCVGTGGGTCCFPRNTRRRSGPECCGGINSSCGAGR